MSAAETDQRLELVLAEARRAVDLQIQSADQGRARASTILATAAVVGGFLGAIAREIDEPPSGSLSVAVLGFGIAAVAACVALAPATFTFDASAKALIRDRIEAPDAVDLAGLRWSLAESYDEWRESNLGALSRIWWAVTVAAAGVTVEVLALLAAVVI